MGIYDRDYYRNEGPSVFDSLMPSGIVCRWLIGINIVAFIFQLMPWPPAQAHGDPVPWFTNWFILDTDAVRHGQIWRLLTYAFLHSPDDFFHILFNMLFLWWFGSDVEQLYGRKEFLAFYLVAAVAGGGAFEVSSLAQGAPARCLGASGAVTALLVLCACHFPHRTILLFFFLPVPIWLFAVFNVARDAFAWLRGTETQVAVVVHLAGAGFAFAYYKTQFRILDWLNGLMWWKHVRSRPRLKIFDPTPEKQEPVAVSATSAPLVVDEHLEAKLDAVLEKIARTGKESLTEQEQQVLIKAAEMYKRRRS